MNIEQMYMFDNNIYAFLLLAILLFVVIVKKDIYDYSRKLFYRMIIFNMIVLLVEVLAWVFDGINTQGAFFFNYLFNCLLILLEPIMASMWLTYVDYKINHSRERLRKRWYYLQASIFSGTLLIVNIFTPVAFTLDSENIYHRGSLLWLSLIFVLIIVLYTLVIAFKNRRELSDRMVIFIAIFAILPVLVSFIQLFVYGLILTWAVVALGVVFAYYLLELTGNSVDHLTGLSSRKKIEEIVTGKIEKKLPFSVIMLDLEFFKQINDKFGHKTGDETLIHFAKVLMRTFGKDNHISRVGGDEFLIVNNIDNMSELLAYKTKLYREMKQYNSFDILNELGVSFGVKLYENANGLTLDTIFDEVDDLMYIDKNINKQRK